MAVYKKGEDQSGLKASAKAQRKDIKKNAEHTSSYALGYHSTQFGGPSVRTLSARTKMTGEGTPVSGAGLAKGAQRAKSEKKNK